MDKQNKSLEEATIKFTAPITADEIEDKLFKHLKKEVSCEILYGRIPEEDSFGGTFRRPFDSLNIASLRFKTESKSIELEIPDYGDVEREEQLKLVSELRQKTNEYFFQRQK